jgi:hypothetical protein
MVRALVVYGGLAAATGAGAVATKGAVRVLLIVVSVVLVALTAWLGLWTVCFDFLVNVDRRRRRRL